MKNALLIMLFGILVFQSPSLFGQAWKSQIGYNELVTQLGGSLPDGTGLVVMQAEAPDGNGNYMPDVAHAEFTGKTITSGSGASGTTGHATAVAKNYFGNTSSMTPGITSITGYDANDYLGNVLGFNSGGDPLATTAFDIGNHSYVGRATGTFTAPMAEDILERFDFVINRDNTVMVVGADNGATSATPRILGPSYNAITVGRSDGNHSQGLTPNYGTPRYAVEIVVPSAGATSFSTPVVSSAAALLRDAGSGTNFIQNEVIRASLFAGATKEEFVSWDKTATRPLDEVFGYGELNILNSYNIFAGGETDASTSNPASNISPLGWDYGNFDGTNDLYYDFTIDPGEYGEVSAILSWNMEITDNSGSPRVFNASRNLADLNLEVFDSSGSFLGTLLDEFSSNGTDYNNEHIYQGFAAGDYTFRVTGDSATDFGFAWRMQKFIGGDIDLDGDVDNADFGAAAGSFNGASGTGKFWADGDFDGDGDVDNADIGVVVGNLAGALAGNLTDIGKLADLVYDPVTGNLKLDASEAAGGIITSFQLESLAALLDANYTGLTGGTFGGALEDVSASMLADSDLTFAGFSGLADLGNILPTGMSLVDLEALLTTAVYTGSSGSGQHVLELTLATAIPEPGAIALLALGGLLTISRRRRAA